MVKDKITLEQVPETIEAIKKGEHLGRTIIARS